MELIEIMKSFEKGITSAGLPEPPKLSQLVHSNEECATCSKCGPAIKEAVEEIGPDNYYPDGRMEITSTTKPGWYNIGGEKIYISAFDIPGKTISTGGKRGTIDLTPLPKKWILTEPLVVTETKKPSYSGTNRELKPTKGMRWHENINPSHNVIVK